MAYAVFQNAVRSPEVSAEPPIPCGLRWVARGAKSRVGRRAAWVRLEAAAGLRLR